MERSAEIQRQHYYAIGSVAPRTSQSPLHICLICLYISLSPGVSPRPPSGHPSVALSLQQPTDRTDHQRENTVRRAHATSRRVHAHARCTKSSVPLCPLLFFSPSPPLAPSLSCARATHTHSPSPRPLGFQSPPTSPLILTPFAITTTITITSARTDHHPTHQIHVHPIAKSTRRSPPVRVLSLHTRTHIHTRSTTHVHTHLLLPQHPSTHPHLCIAKPTPSRPARTLLYPPFQPLPSPTPHATCLPRAHIARPSSGTLGRRERNEHARPPTQTPHWSLLYAHTHNHHHHHHPSPTAPGLLTSLVATHPHGSPTPPSHISGRIS